jgi:hypothetical protein
MRGTCSGLGAGWGMAQVVEAYLAYTKPGSIPTTRKQSKNHKSITNVDIDHWNRKECPKIQPLKCGKNRGVI